jgi:outer membrane lipoprotein-sorting protein
MDSLPSITRRLFLFLTGGMLAKLGFACARGDESSKKLESASEILRQMAETYKNCKSYQDSGTVTTIFHHKDGKQHMDSKPFNTAFVRPDQFRFEFKSSFDGKKWHRYIVWANGKDVRSWWNIRPRSEDTRAKLDHPESLALALAGPTGVSGGSAHTVPTLLLPTQIDGKRLTDLTELKRLDDSDIKHIHCYRIQGTMPLFELTPAERDRLRKDAGRLGRPQPEEAKRGPMVVWIDRATFLVRRIEQKVEFESFRTESTTEYEPTVEAPVAEKQ